MRLESPVAPTSDRTEAPVAEALLAAPGPDRELAGVVAHGLLNTVAVLSGSAHTLLEFGDALSDAERESLVVALEGSATLFGDGMVMLANHGSEAFENAATAMVRLGRTIRSVADEDLVDVLARAVEGAPVVIVGLNALVRGLPAEVVELLERLQR